MPSTKLPKRWTGKKLRRVLTHYERQTEESAVLEDEAGVGASETDLVPKVRELIAKRQR